MKILILDVYYTVSFLDTAAFDLAEVDGYCDKKEHIIAIDKSLKDEAFTETLWHEILHALWHEWRFPSEQDEEATVTWMARAMQKFVRQNPVFTRHYLL